MSATINGNGNGIQITHGNGTQAILERTLVELKDRAAKLQVFVDELKEAQAAIKVIERAMGSAPAPRVTTTRVPTETRTDAVIEMLKGRGDPVSPAEVAGELSIGSAYASQLLTQMVVDKQLVKVGRGAYGLPCNVDTEGEHADA